MTRLLRRLLGARLARVPPERRLPAGPTARGATVLMLVLAAVFVSATAGSSAAGADGAGSGPSGSAGTPDPATQAAVIRARQDWEQQRAYRDSASGRDERAASRTAYRGQSAAEAKRTAEEKFPSLLAATPLHWPDLQRGEAVR